MRTSNDLSIPPEFEMPPSRLRYRREHLVTELRQADSPVRRRRGRRRWALTVAGAACAAVAAVPALDLLGSSSSGGGVVDRAVATVSSDEAIYHVVTLFSIRHQTDDPRVLDAFDLEGVDLFEDRTQYSEAWIGPGNRNRILVYEANGGDRGRLLQESTFDGSVGHVFDARANKVIVIRSRRSENRPVPQPQGPVQPELHPTEDPAVQLRRLHEQGRLRLAGRENVRGRSAYRLASDTWVDPNEKGHTERVEFLVDAETYLPLEQRSISTQLGVSGLPREVRPSAEMYETPVTTTATREFLTYEKLPLSEDNLSRLEPRPHPGATVFDPDAPRRENPAGARRARP
jgi:hypothetical protein